MGLIETDKKITKSSSLAKFKINFSNIIKIKINILKRYVLGCVKLFELGMSVITQNSSICVDYEYNKLSYIFWLDTIK